VKFSTFGLALRSVKPPTVMVTVTVVGFAVLFTVLIVNEVSYVPGTNADVAVFAVSTSGVGEPAVTFTTPDGAICSHGGVLLVLTDTMVEVGALMWMV
jgi:hypothetical protein